MDLNLNGRKVLITGGSAGIGLACAEVLASEGCTVHIAARDRIKLEAAAEKIRNTYGAEVFIYSVDLSNPASIPGLAEKCGDIDILINNAGAIPNGDLWQVDEERWRESWDLKVFGFINLTRAIYSKMRGAGKGVIINVIGAAGEKPRGDYIAGSTGNAALMAFTRAMGASSLKENIRVVGINPGLIVTERLVNILRNLAKAKFDNEERWEELKPRNPSPGKPEDIANLAAFLASDLAGFITGTIVTADGGYSAG